MEQKLKDALLDLMLSHRYVVETPVGQYRFVCNYKHGVEGQCPNNDDGICRLVHDEIPWFFVHKYNGRKMFKCPCG